MSLTTKEYFHIYGVVKHELLADLVDDQEELISIRDKTPDFLDDIETYTFKDDHYSFDEFQVTLSQLVTDLKEALPEKDHYLMVHILKDLKHLKMALLRDTEAINLAASNLAKEIK